MSTFTYGLVHGNTITLESRVEELDGQRVRVVIEPAGAADLRLTLDQNAALRREWIERGPQGPIEDSIG